VLTAATTLPRPAATGHETPAVVFEHVHLAFDEKVILKDVSFTLMPGHTKIILGASGAGKSMSLKILLGLLKPDGGKVFVNGHRVDELTEDEMMAIRSTMGMVFQEGALFDSLTVRENVGYRLYEEMQVPLEQADKRVEEVLGVIGLAEFIDRMPSALSGGQRRRVAIARAMASKPHLLLYDEATTGLDPITGMTVDNEIIKLRDIEKVSTIVVTHQLRDAFYVATRAASSEADGRIRIAPADHDKECETEFLMLRDGLIVFEGDAETLRRTSDPYMRSFLS